MRFIVLREHNSKYMCFPFWKHFWIKRFHSNTCIFLAFSCGISYLQQMIWEYHLYYIVEWYLPHNLFGKMQYLEYLIRKNIASEFIYPRFVHISHYTSQKISRSEKVRTVTHANTDNTIIFLNSFITSYQIL